MSRILVIDDDQGVRDTMARMLRGVGFNVETAGTRRTKHPSHQAPKFQAPSTKHLCNNLSYPCPPLSPLSASRSTRSC